MHVHSLCFLEEMHVLQHACAACMLPSFEENHWKQAKNGSKQHQHASAPLAHHFPRCTSLRFPIHLNDSHTYPHECYEIFLAQHVSPSHLSCLASDLPCPTSLSIFLAWPLTSFLLATIVWRPAPPRVLVAVWHEAAHDARSCGMG